jgi:hypothetical protein
MLSVQFVVQVFVTPIDNVTVEPLTLAMVSPAGIPKP